ncbi:DUF6461 domain-containing protein [Streptomyces nigrescens]|uniref:DUF6461 domain-containing protein n=1 Tax=Streptomyces nigrescens TaxID=1920 RepID=UPI003471B959
MTGVNPLAWIADGYPAHCLTLARDLTGRDLLKCLGAKDEEMFFPADEVEADEFVWAGMEDYWAWGAARAGEAGGWAFALEPASLWGSIPERLRRASTGTEAICCAKADGMVSIAYWQNGALVTRFEVTVPQIRPEGAGPAFDRLVQQMELVGFDDEAVPAGHRGLALLYEVTGAGLSLEQTVSALSAKLPAEGLGPEGPHRATHSAPLADSSFGTAAGGAVGVPSAPRAAGSAKIVPGAGAAG